MTDHDKVVTWAANHVKAGEDALAEAERMLQPRDDGGNPGDRVERATALAAIAQAHFLAAALPS